VLVTTLTKRTAEDLAAYLREAGLKVAHLHSDIDAIERVKILRQLRLNDFDCLVGINLLREGLDIPEVALVAILDADKEGFLRSATALIQVAGRTARHLNGKVILYADKVTDSMKRMMDVTSDRRARQMKHNEEHGITPRSIEKAVRGELSAGSDSSEVNRRVVKESGVDYDVEMAIEEIEAEMFEAAKNLEFERAAELRDELIILKKKHGQEKGPARKRKKK